jgi:iron complex outermembrane receptor protein
VVKGPDSVLFGRAQPGGLVNVVSRPILPQFAADLEETASQLGATRSTARVSGRLNKSGSLLLRASGTWFADKTGRAFVRDRLGWTHSDVARDAANSIGLVAELPAPGLAQ